jgi:hypothetical protein
MAYMTGMAIEMAKHYKGMKDSIDLLKTLRDPKTMKTRRWTPFEGVPKSIPTPKAA